jgi:outer membrane autotransporter protein
VLNQGDAATRSDTLAVDGTLVGAGASSMAIRNAGGGGALTVGDGILVVEVKDPARSAPGAFTLNGGLISAGAFDYFLFKGRFSPGSQGNWYLRNVLRPTPEPEPTPTPLPTLVPGAPPIPPAERPATPKQLIRNDPPSSGRHCRAMRGSRVVRLIPHLGCLIWIVTT